MRDIVYKLLLNYEKGSFLNLSLKQLKLDETIQKNVTIRVYGIVQNYIYLDYILDQKTDKKLDLNTRIILKMAIYEKLYLNSVPEYAIISEYINLADKKYKKSKNFISYFLNNNLKDIELIEPTYKNEAKNLSIKYSVAQWLVKKIMVQYPENYEIILKQNLLKKKTFVRKIDSSMQLENFDKYLFDDLYIYNGNVVKNIHFINKDVVIQDFGSYLIPKLLSPASDEIVLDLCAAPGNKTIQIAKEAKKVVANEINISRYNLLKQNIKDYNQGNVEVVNCDASDYNELDRLLMGEVFDKILIDAPCSGVGVISSKPEIKNKLKIEDVNGLVALQKNILEVALKFLKEDGELIYSTCSILKEENEEQMKWLMEKYNLIEIVDEDLKKLTQSKSKIGITLLPNVHNSDGFYMCKLKKG